MKTQTEIELKFLVPQHSRASLAAEMARATATSERRHLAAMYLDTADRRLARHGLAWRLRLEDRQWVQALKAGGTHALERFEHEVARPDANHDATLHAGTHVGDQLIALLRRAHEDGIEPEIRFQTDVRRSLRKVRTLGAVVEVAFDEGRLLAAGSSVRIREIEFELVAGSATAMLALVERWRKRFKLVYDPRSKAERGGRLAEGSAFPPVRKALAPAYSDKTTATEALGAVLDECLAHIARNAIGVTEGDPQLLAEHVHQLRVGIRRLRSAARCFRDWAPSPPAELDDGLRAMFAALGTARDNEVLDHGVAAQLRMIGAPELTLPAPADAPDAKAAVLTDEAQRTLLGWIAWRAHLARDPHDRRAETTPGDAKPVDSSSLHHRIERRLRRWHKRIVLDWNGFDELDEAGLHALRKRIKRQRYAIEFLAPFLSKKKTKHYLAAAATIQDRMGELNDLIVARKRYESLVESTPAAWFALGWLASQFAQSRDVAKSELARFAKLDSPVRQRPA